VSAEWLLAAFHRVAEAPDAVDRLRGLVLALAVRGDLASHGPPLNHESYRSRSEAIENGMRDLASTRPRYRWKPTVELTARETGAPPGWIPNRLGDTGLYVNGVAFTPSDWAPSGRPIIRIQNLTGVSSVYNRTRREVGPDALVQEGDLLVSWSATLGAFIWDGPEGVLNQHIFKVIPNRAATTPRFLYWLLKHEVRTLAESQHAHGLAMMHINRGPFLGHPILLPPLHEQDRIVAKVEELMDMCDELEVAQAVRERRRDRLAEASLTRVRTDTARQGARFWLQCAERMITRPEHVAGVRELILDLAVAGRLVPQDPSDESASALVASTSESHDRGPFLGAAKPHRINNWVSSSVRQLASLVTSGSRGWAQYYAPTGAAFIRSQNVKRGKLVMSELAHVNPPTGSEGTRTAAQSGDLLVVITGDIGNVAIWDGQFEPAYVSQHIALVRPNDVRISKWILLCLLASSAGRGHLLASIYGGKPGLNLDNVRDVPVPLPPLPEQRRIIEKVDELMALCDQVERSLTAVRTGRTRLLEAVLHEALAEDGVDAEQILAVAH
jgi:type I restriction enzyme, S subunit